MVPWERPKTHIQRRDALHDCLPRLLGDEESGRTQIEIVYGEEENILYWADQSS